MNNFYNSLAKTFGPLVQAIFFFFILFLTAWCIGAAAFWGERKLLQLKSHAWGTLPFLIFAVGILYSGLRFSGLLLYSTDGWDQWGCWNYTNQNGGVCVLFIFGCLMTGSILAVCKEKTLLKMVQ